jgi:SAM-dependent methyltransferase
MDEDAKHAEIEVYDNEDDTRPNYGSLWDDEHFQQLLDAGPERSFEQLLREHVDDSRVLILGCGNGHNVQSCMNWNASHVVGIELSATRISEAAGSIHDERVAFARADAEELPFSSDSFDVVISHSVLHHLPNWRVIALEEIRRVLTTDGVMLVYEPGRYNPAAAVRRRVFPSNIHTVDEQPFDPTEFESILSSHFEDVTLEGHCLISNTLPVIANYFPLKIPLRLTKKTYELERSLIQGIGYRFSWIITGVVRSPKPLTSD